MYKQAIVPKTWQMFLVWHYVSRLGHFKTCYMRKAACQEMGVSFKTCYAELSYETITRSQNKNTVALYTEIL